MLPTSNLLTTAVSSLARHPLPLFLRHGICATLNTDDPSLMGGLRLEDEYRLARDQMGLGPDELSQVQRNGLQAAFLDEAEKQRLREELPGGQARRALHHPPANRCGAGPQHFQLAPVALNRLLPGMGQPNLRAGALRISSLTHTRPASSSFARWLLRFPAVSPISRCR